MNPFEPPKSLHNRINQHGKPGHDGSWLVSIMLLVSYALVALTIVWLMIDAVLFWR